jgi:methylmalonyl-CoA mutase, C-terminal domain
VDDSSQNATGLAGATATAEQAAPRRAGGHRTKVLVVKPGLDGHDRGAKVIAIALKEAGMEVVYMGLHQTVEAIVRAGIDEDVDVIGLSILTGGHLPICRRLMELLRAEGADDMAVCVGGVIPKKDIPVLEAMGVKGVFPGGTHLDDIVAAITALTR